MAAEEQSAAETALTPAQAQGRIYSVHGQNVMVNSDPAELYGVTTGALNQAVKRNEERFPKTSCLRSRRTKRSV